ncbi:MAG: 30S ribosomal protein S20 [Pirellulaceae bacterium]
MPNSQSAKKRLRQSLEDRARNRACKSVLRGMLRNVREAVKGGKIEEAQKLIPAVYKKLDQAAAKKMIHTNKASRLKSRLSQLVVSAKVQGS